MKNPLAKLPNEKAQKELIRFLEIGYICTIIAFLIFGWLAIAGIGAGARAIMLSYHGGNNSNPKIKQLRLAAYGLVGLAVFEFALFLS